MFVAVPRSSWSRAAPREGVPGAASAQDKDKPVARHSPLPWEAEQEVMAVPPVNTPAPKSSMESQTSVQDQV